MPCSGLAPEAIAKAIAAYVASAPPTGLLRDARYDGVVSVEVFKFDDGAETIATKSLEYLKKIFA